MVAVTRLGMTMRVGPEQNCFPWVNTRAAVQLKKCKAKSESNGIERILVSRVFSDQAPKYFCFLGNR